MVGCKARLGGINPATGLDHFGLLVVVARRLGLIDKSVAARFSTTGVNFENPGHAIVFGTLRRCVIARRFGVEIPISKVQPGDFATTIEPGEPDPETGLTMAAEPVLIVTGLDPLIVVHVPPERGVVEEQVDFKLLKAFRLRTAAINLDETSIFREQYKMANDLYQKALFATILGKLR